MRKKRSVPPSSAGSGDGSPWVSASLPEPERIVGLGFRYGTEGWKSRDIAPWSRAWQLYYGLFGHLGACEAVGRLSSWVDALNRASAREIEVLPWDSRGFCRDECIAVAMIAACQNDSCPAVRACALALSESSLLDGLVEAQAFADLLMSLDQVLSRDLIPSAAFS